MYYNVGYIHAQNKIKQGKGKENEMASIFNKIGKPHKRDDLKDTKK